ncbi:MAG: ImmA/IrrE family metallo-endopeptidase [Cyanobacteria bacterium HKST-UBA02]|nr:ImmA/IrrE family metallo-endopeptidase [Cyanobacteria bacterium HKST-UBA02]
MTDLNDLTAQEIGRRLRIARENANIRQDDAAQVIGMSRPTLVSIEKGDRRVRIQELQKLARHYGLSVNALLRREAVHIDLMPRFRKLRETEDTHTTEAVQLFNDLIKADVELRDLLGIPQKRNYPPERGINQGNVMELAEKHAQELRDWLGLGSGPIADIFSIIELDLGIRLFQRPLSSRSKVAGLFHYDESVGACIFLNSNHRLSRRVHSAAHELGHFYGTRHTPEVLEDDERFLSRDERYADAFGRAFLMPTKSFSASFYRLKEITGKITRRLIILLSHQHGVSREACTRQLETLGLAKKGTWDWFQKNGGITDQQTKEVLGDMADRPDPVRTAENRLLSHRMSLMAHKVWERKLMSEGQLAELLKIGRVELREIVDQIELEEIHTNDLLQLPD